MLEIFGNKPTYKEIRDAIKKLSEMLNVTESLERAKKFYNDDKENLEELKTRNSKINEAMEKEKENSEIGLKEISEIHKGRLDRQGKDIFILWNKVDNLEKQVFRMKELIEENEVEKQLQIEELSKTINRISERILNLEIKGENNEVARQINTEKLIKTLDRLFG